MDGAAPRLCGWCRVVPLTDVRASYCSRRCRQTAFRLRRRSTRSDASSTPGCFAYADPPYPGLSSKYYRDESSYAGEVDHAALIASLEASRYAGWALSTSARALRDVLPLCPPTARVCAWTKPIGVPPRTKGIHSTWEPVIVVGGRQRPPGVRDWLRAMPARLGGDDLMGRKPIAFAAWLFDLLGMAPGDELVDLFPGTGVIGRAWAELSSMPTASGSSGARSRRFLPSVVEVPGDVSPAAAADGSPEPSLRAALDGSPGAHADASAVGMGDVSQEYSGDELGEGSVAA